MFLISNLSGLIHSRPPVSFAKRLFQRSVIAFSLPALLMLGGLASTSALAAPGTPGTPQAPITVYTENFENVPVSTTAQALESYTGAAPLSETYTADPVWLSANNSCNGIVLSSNMNNTNGIACGAFPQLQSLANTLGGRNGSAIPGDNHVVAGYTNSSTPGTPGMDTVEFETVNRIPLSFPNSRFVTFSVNAAAINCYAGGPLYKFYLVDPSSGTETATFTAPINPCTSPQPPVPAGPNPILSGSYASNSAILFSGASLKIRMRNGNGSGSGNDAAFDDIKALDATPQLDKSFSPANQVFGLTSTLTLTITNTTDLASKNGWSFTDTLPVGLIVAAPVSASTNCPSGAVTAVSGGNTVAGSGNLTAGLASCTVTVAVTSNIRGTFTNNASNITSSVGLTPPGSASVTFADAPFANMSTTINLPQNVAAGSTVNGSFTCTNGGVSDASAATCSITGLPAAATVNCAPPVPVANLASGNSIVCSVSFTMPSTPVTATATAGSNTPDPDLTNNTARATVSNPAVSLTGVPMNEPWMIVSLILLLAGVVGAQQTLRRKL